MKGKFSVRISVSDNQSFSGKEILIRNAVWIAVTPMLLGPFAHALMETLPYVVKTIIYFGLFGTGLVTHQQGARSIPFYLCIFATVAFLAMQYGLLYEYPSILMSIFGGALLVAAMLVAVGAFLLAKIDVSKQGEALAFLQHKLLTLIALGLMLFFGGSPVAMVGMLVAAALPVTTLAVERNTVFVGADAYKHGAYTLWQLGFFIMIVFYIATKMGGM